MNALVGTTGSRRLPVEILAEHEVKALIRASSTRAPTGVRNRALLATLYRSGLRISKRSHSSSATSTHTPGR